MHVLKDDDKDTKIARVHARGSGITWFPVIAERVNAPVFPPGMNLLGKVILSFAMKDYCAANILFIF